MIKSIQIYSPHMAVALQANSKSPNALHHSPWLPRNKLATNCKIPHLWGSEATENWCDLGHKSANTIKRDKTVKQIKDKTA